LTVLHTIWLLISAISLLLLILVGITVYFVPFKEWFHISAMSGAEIAIVIMLFAAQVAVGQQVLLLGQCFRCDGNFAGATMWYTVQRLGEFVLLMIGLLVGAGPVIAAAIMLGIRVIMIVVLRWRLWRLSPWLSFGVSRADRATMARLAGPAFAFMAVPLGQALRNDGPITVIGLLLGPEFVTIFGVFRKLANAGTQVLVIINNSVWPEMSTALGTKDSRLARNLHRRSCQAAFWLSLLLAGGLFLGGPLVLRLWTVGKVNMDYAVFALLLVGMVASSFWYTSWVVPLAINRHQKTAVLFIIGNVLALLVAVLLIPFLGLSGAAGALLIIDALMIPFVLRDSLELVHDSLGRFCRVVFDPPVRFMWQTCLAWLSSVPEPSLVKTTGEES